MDWPDGSHSFAGFHTDHSDAQRLLRKVQHRWRPRPVAGSLWRPTALAVVEISERDWRLHARRHGCRSPSCPTPATPTKATPHPGSAR